MTNCSQDPSDPRRPITAQERQREREEKRRRRQERAKERERKQKERERKELKDGDILGGVVLSQGDKSLLERWMKMMEGRGRPEAGEGGAPLINGGFGAPGPSFDGPEYRPGGLREGLAGLGPSVGLRPSSGVGPSVGFRPSVALEPGVGLGPASGLGPGTGFGPASGLGPGAALRPAPSDCEAPAPAAAPKANIPSSTPRCFPVNPFQVPVPGLAPVGETAKPRGEGLRPPHGTSDPGIQHGPGPAFPAPPQLFGAGAGVPWARPGPATLLPPALHEGAWPGPDPQASDPSLPRAPLPHDGAGFARLVPRDGVPEAPAFPQGPAIPTAAAEEQQKAQGAGLRSAFPVAPFDASSSDSADITTVTHQLSKSQVKDLLPPVFSVTPKGSGAGYGVGFDLEEFLNQSFDMVGDSHDSQGDSAPLSASLLSDWLEVHRMNPADMESLQQELQLGSPMILSDVPDL